MKRTRVTRFVRRAVTLACLILCGFFAALWIRSYYRWDLLEVKNGWQLMQVRSERGRLEFWYDNLLRGSPPLSPSLAHELMQQLSYGRTFRSERVTEMDDFLEPFQSHSVFGFVWASNGTIGSVVYVPDWFLLLLCAGLAVFIQIPWSKRFGLRTLLFTTTLIAVALGLVAVGLRSSNASMQAPGGELRPPS
jgi:hypothetical protein